MPQRRPRRVKSGNVVRVDFRGPVCIPIDTSSMLYTPEGARRFVPKWALEAVAEIDRRILRAIDDATLEIERANDEKTRET
jgi:hypothetical protein